jgi:hypothetical protein
MSETIDTIITADTLRTAIRAQIRRGTRRETVSALINAYAAPEARTMRRHGNTERLPVQTIPYGRRMAFLDALNRLPDERAQKGILIAELVS